MLLTAQQLQTYFDRTGFTGTASPDLTTLQALHALHPQTFAFENLDSWLGVPVSLQTEAVANKLLLCRRGGYCFEQNQLFMRVLLTLGYEVQGLSARVQWMLPEHLVLPRTHMVLLVKVDGKAWLADVGFGGLTMTAALELDSTAIQSTPHEPFRLDCKSGIYTLSAQVAEQWQVLYSFTLDAQLPVDYETANWYVSTYPQSRFVQQLIAGRADVKGRHALLDKRYSWHQPGAASVVTELDSPVALRTILQQKLLLDTDGLPGLEQKISTLFGTRP